MRFLYFADTEVCGVGALSRCPGWGDAHRHINKCCAGGRDTEEGSGYIRSEGEGWDSPSRQKTICFCCRNLLKSRTRWCNFTAVKWWGATAWSDRQAWLFIISCAGTRRMTQANLLVRRPNAKTFLLSIRYVEEREAALETRRAPQGTEEENHRTINHNIKLQRADSSWGVICGVLASEIPTAPFCGGNPASG